jgi:hypothetical protein
LESFDIEGTEFIKIDVNEMEFESLTVSSISEFCTGEEESSGCIDVTGLYETLVLACLPLPEI